MVRLVKVGSAWLLCTTVCTTVCTTICTTICTTSSRKSFQIGKRQGKDDVLLFFGQRWGGVGWVEVGNGPFSPSSVSSDVMESRALLVPTTRALPW